MLNLQQAQCLFEIVRAAKRAALWTADDQWQVPNARELASILYPAEEASEAVRKTNLRIRRLAKYVPSLAGKPRTINPNSLVTAPQTAHYLLIFRHLTKNGDVTKEDLHSAVLARPGKFHYENSLLEHLFEFSCREGYIHLAAPTIPGGLYAGKALTEQEHYLRLFTLKA